MKILSVMTLLMTLSILKHSTFSVEAGLFDRGYFESSDYGPQLKKIRDYYNFDYVKSAFDSKVNLGLIDELNKKEFELIILSSFDELHQERLKRFLPFTLKMAEAYQVDPLWVISVMMVESNFNHEAVSSVNALGVMQVKPDTAQEMYLRMQKKIEIQDVEELMFQPEENIEVGVLYLKKLLQNFRMNHHLATSAYNLGPTGLRQRLQGAEFDFSKYQYIKKVKNHYQKLAVHYKAYLLDKRNSYNDTYAYSGAKEKNELN